MADIEEPHAVHLLPRWHLERDDEAMLAGQKRHYTASMDLCTAFQTRANELHAFGLGAMEDVASHTLRKRDLRDLIYNLCEDIEGFRLLGDALVIEIRRKEFEIQRLHQEIYAEQRNNRSLRADKVQLQHESVGLHDRIAEMNRSITTLTVRLDEQNNANNNLHREIDRLLDQCSSKTRSSPPIV